MVDEMPLPELLNLTRSGDHPAMLELFRRYADLVGRQSYRFGQHVTFDIDDARQTAFISMLDTVSEAAESSLPFTALFELRLTDDLREEANQQRFQAVVPLRIFQYIYETVAKFDGDESAAREHLATIPDSRRRVSRDTFDSILFWAFGWRGYITDEDVADEANPFIRVEDRDAVEALLSTLTDIEREVIERTYGLGEFEPQTSEVAGHVMRMLPKSIRRIHSRVLAKLQINSDLPAHYPEPVEAKPKERLHSTKPRVKRKPTPTSFPVTVTRIKEIA